MIGYITDYSGREYRLPAMLSWSVCHTLGEPADSFELCCLFESGMLAHLSDAVRFRGEHSGETVFNGVVDEFEVECSGAGRTVSMSGRGLAALLLDNEAEAAEYGACSLAEIITRHVKPYGVTEITADELPSVSGYSVKSGSSQWKVLSSFTDCVSGIIPRFSRDGVLVISAAKGRRLKLDTNAAYDVSYREKRYGVISEVLVKNTLRGTSATVSNDDFIARGGCARRVLTVPRKTGAESMRYTGAYQIGRSESDRVILRLTVPTLFAAFPNDAVSLSMSELGVEGEYLVRASECWADATGAGTRLELIPN